MRVVTASDRSFLSNYFLYVGVIGAALLSVALGLTDVTGIASGLTVVKKQDSGLPRREQTLLDIRIQNQREIRQALAKPLPPLEPLPRITARVIPTAGNAARSAIVPSQSHPQKLMSEARSAFANIVSSFVNIQPSAYAEIDRHAAR
jgi:hypothetical protein